MLMITYKRCVHTIQYLYPVIQVLASFYSTVSDLAKIYQSDVFVVFTSHSC